MDPVDIHLASFDDPRRRRSARRGQRRDGGEWLLIMLIVCMVAALAVGIVAGVVIERRDAEARESREAVNDWLKANGFEDLAR